MKITPSFCCWSVVVVVAAAVVVVVAVVVFAYVVVDAWRGVKPCHSSDEIIVSVAV